LPSALVGSSLRQGHPQWHGPANRHDITAIPYRPASFKVGSHGSATDQLEKPVTIKMSAAAQSEHWHVYLVYGMDRVAAEPVAFKEERRQDLLQ